VGWTTDSKVDYSYLEYFSYLRYRVTLLDSMRCIISNINNMNYVKCYVVPDSDITYYINSYVIPSVRILTVTNRKILLRKVIYNEAIHQEISEELTPTFGLFNAVLKSYTKPFQQVNCRVDNFLDPEDIAYWNQTRKYFRSSEG
jgi:hypothetical protein